MSEGLTTRLVSVQEVAELLNISAVYRRVESGEWPSIKIGNRRLLSAAWVHALIDSAARGNS
jgi:excisionase family DNA binding protein